jgi:hypothetical protein
VPLFVSSFWNLLCVLSINYGCCHSKYCLVSHELNVKFAGKGIFLHVIILSFNLGLHYLKFDQVVQAVCCVYWKSFLCTYLAFIRHVFITKKSGKLGARRAFTLRLELRRAYALLSTPWHFVNLCNNGFLKIETKKNRMWDDCHLTVHLAHFLLKFPGPISQSNLSCCPSIYTMARQQQQGTQRQSRTTATTTCKAMPATQHAGELRSGYTTFGARLVTGP